MKRSEVALGHMYLAKVSDRVVPVRLDGEHPKRGWLATNQVTGKLVHIQSAQRLRSEVRRGSDAVEPAPATQPAPPPPEPSATPDEPATAPATPTRIPSYAERLMFNGATDPAAARAALANIHTGGSEDDDMASKKKTTKPKAPKTAAPKATGTKAPAPPAKAKAKMSALDAAAKVLEERGEPMSTGDMIEEMAAKRYWKSPGGKTPAATLYSAILREINLKGKDARFKKTDRGMFARTKAE